MDCASISILDNAGAKLVKMGSLIQYQLTIAGSVPYACIWN